MWRPLILADLEDGLRVHDPTTQHLENTGSPRLLVKMTLMLSPVSPYKNTGLVYRKNSGKLMMHRMCGDGVIGIKFL